MDTSRSDGRRRRIEASLAWLARYDAIVDDPAAFRAALEPPTPVDLLVHPKRTTPAALGTELAARGLAVETFEWAPYHLRVGAGDAPLPGAGTLPEVVFGYAFPQGASSATAAQALAPRAGEVVADLCAAPGGKTALLSFLADDRARIVAGDPSADRCGLLVTNLARMALTGPLVVKQDAAALPPVAAFDAILLDAPCTGEGTFRLASPRYEPRGESGLGSARALQRRLLARALDRLAPGGRLVYATCSYAPEENEQVLAEALAARDDVVLAPLPDGTPGQPGLTAWGELHFPADMTSARRLFPHHTGSWGFFLAKLEKRAGGGGAAAAPGPHPTPASALEPPADDPEAGAELATFLADRFGVDTDAALAGQLVTARGRDLWLLARPDALAGRDVDLGALSIVAPGMRALHRTNTGPRATNSLLRWLGPWITQRVAELDGETARRMLAYGPLPCPDRSLRGSVAVRVDGVVVGAGHVRDGMLQFEIPAAWR
jgi:16S rRNA C967 or C1407 C5-methylase (RsmB/RsmF family)